MLQLTPSPQRNDSPDVLNHKLRTKNQRLVDIMHKSAALMPGFFIKEPASEFILPFETMHIQSPNICQASKLELVKNSRTGRRHQDSHLHLQHSFPAQNDSLQISEQSTNSPQNPKPNTAVPSLSLVKSSDYTKEVKPYMRKYTIQQDSAYQFKPISKSLLFELELHLEQEADKEVQEQNEEFSVSQQEVEEQQFKDLRHSTSQLQKEQQNDRSNLEIQILSPVYSISKRVIISSRETFISDARISKFKQILTRKTEQNNTLKMILTKDSQAFNMLWPQYSLKFSKDEHPVMIAKRTSNAFSYTYNISIDPRDFSENSGFYLGKIKSNHKANVFNVYDSGLNPKNAQAKHTIPRQLIATIIYEQTKGSPSRLLKLFVRKDQCHYYLSFPQVKMYKQQISLDCLYSYPENKQKIDFYINAQDNQNKMNLNSHQGDKYIQSSVVLKHSLTREEVIALSKVDSLTSNLSVSAPLSPLVAFAITLANLNINP